MEDVKNVSHVERNHSYDDVAQSVVDDGKGKRQGAQTEDAEENIYDGDHG